MIKTIIAVALLLFIGCSNESDISDIYISVPIDYYDVEVNSGEKIFYPIEITSNKDKLSRVQITYSDNIDGTITLYEDNTLDTRSHSFEYEYESKEYSQHSEVNAVLRILAVDESGYVGQLALKITINSAVESDDVILTDISSVSLYSGASNKENGYTFLQSKFVNYNTADSLTVDFYDYPADDLSETLSLEWRSMTGRYFARLTGFDYSNATLNSVLNGYSLAEKSDLIRGIAENDVIFIGYDDQTPLAVIKVSAIIDYDGVDNDKYIISMKRTYLEDSIEGWFDYEPIDTTSEESL